MMQVTISRYWRHPAITTEITDEQIAIKIGLDDWLVALEEEMAPRIAEEIAKEFRDLMLQNIGSVTWTLTAEQFKAKFDAAFEVAKQGASTSLRRQFKEVVKLVTARIKEESAKVISHT